MSKSLGTGIDPLEAVAQHGADATRYGLLKISSTQDVRFCWGAIEEGAKLANKLWNVARLVLQNAERVEPALRPHDARGAMDPGPHRCRRVRRSRRHCGAASTSRTATNALYHLTFDDFCDWYAEAIKPRLYDRDEDAIATALGALERLLALLHPVLPHVTEEIWSHLPDRTRADRLGLARAGRRSPATRARSTASRRRRRPSGAAVCRSSSDGRRGADLRRGRPAGADPGERRRRRRARAPAEGDRARRGDARERALRRQRAGATSSRPEREKLERYRRELAALGGVGLRIGLERCPRTGAWVASLSPWPRTVSVSTACGRCSPQLGDPQRAYPAIHVVGTNGKSTATRTIEALLLGDGFSVGSTVSPHVRGWAERIRVDGRGRGLRGRRSPRAPSCASSLRRTQFETLTAAALAEFATRRVDVAVVEAGLGGRLDATNVLDTRVVLLTNVGLEHTDVLGETAEEIAAEKLAVARGDSVVVMPDNKYAALLPTGVSFSVARGRPRRCSRATRSRAGPTSRFRGGSSAGRRAQRRRAQPGRRPLADRPSAWRRLHRVRVDPPRQGAPRCLRVCQAWRAADSCRRSPRTARAARGRPCATGRAAFRSIEAVADRLQRSHGSRARRAGARDGLALPARRPRGAGNGMRRSVRPTYARLSSGRVGGCRQDA